MLNILQSVKYITNSNIQIVEETYLSSCLETSLLEKYFWMHQWKFALTEFNLYEKSWYVHSFYNKLTMCPPRKAVLYTHKLVHLDEGQVFLEIIAVWHIFQESTAHKVLPPKERSFLEKSSLKGGAEGGRKERASVFFLMLWKCHVVAQG